MSAAERPPLAPLQRRALALIESSWGPLSVAEVAVRLRVGRSSAGAALEDLRERKLIRWWKDGDSHGYVPWSTPD